MLKEKENKQYLIESLNPSKKTSDAIPKYPQDNAQPTTCSNREINEFLKKYVQVFKRYLASSKIIFKKKY